MATQRLVLETITEDDYELIAIHCSLAPYRVAFLLNTYLDLHLYRKKEDINFEYGDVTANYPLFQYEDHFHYNTYNLLGNQCKVIIQLDATSEDRLFESSNDDMHITKYLIPEMRKVDYFLKIETETSQFSGKSLANQLLTIPQVLTAYVVDYTQLKSKNNLIFE
ncbi:IPExxxVDY family protein [Aquimarina addita]|uniref:IPExxxVDY family protein n=1 Tax=Aquimarina addita TaxID=870485 RepID=A0ABP7XA63_9FLAO